MSQVVAAAYLAPNTRVRPKEMGPTAEAFYSACASTDFPFDIGDDPSFFCSQHFGGPVTWGVCRPDARGLISPDDCVAFFSAERDEKKIRYRFVAGFQVERLTSHLAIWSPGENRVFSNYLNLLVRPNGGAWEHHEPGLHSRQWHADWIWRMCVRRGLNKDDVVAAGTTGALTTDLKATGMQVQVADTYVVFRHDNAVLAQPPIPVAEFVQGSLGGEAWNGGAAVLALKRHVFGTAASRALRTTNPQQPHRHVRRSIADAGAWMRDLASLAAAAAQQGLAAGAASRRG